ncbi:hypothetical protein CSUI_008162, partial [Cystoisospora suis]
MCSYHLHRDIFLSLSWSYYDLCHCLPSLRIFFYLLFHSSADQPTSEEEEMTDRDNAALYRNKK